MFDNLKNKISDRLFGREPHDPSIHNDPIAIKTDWKPAKKSGASFRTDKLVSIDSNRVEFKATTGARLFYLAFICVGFGMLLYFVKEYYPFTGNWEGNLFVLPLCGFLFFCTGAFMFFMGEKPNVFDKIQGYYYKGKKPFLNSFNHVASKDCCLLDDIYAIQLIAERCSGKNSYYSYELNLVLRDASRINVIDHGSKEWVNSDAQTLSEFLNKPIWSAL